MVVQLTFLARAPAWRRGNATKVLLAVLLRHSMPLTELRDRGGAAVAAPPHLHGSHLLEWI